MPTLTLFNQSGSQSGSIDVGETVFGIAPNKHVLHEAVVMQQASRRQGTHHTKNRTQVRGGGRKPWRQKGTGNARQGSIRAPQWVGGGVVFGPTPKSYRYKLPKKVRRLAMKSALSLKVQEENLLVVDDLSFEQPKTKEMVEVLSNLSLARKVLVVTADYDEAVHLSARNIPGVKVITSAGVNVLDVLDHDKVVMTQDAVKKTEEVLGS